MKKINILFVCRHNKFRSKIAEAYFKKINKNPDVFAKSAGIFPSSGALEPLQVKTAKRLGIPLKGKSKPVSTGLLRWQTFIVAIMEDYPKGLFNWGPYNNKVVSWKIKDEMKGDEKETERIIKKIMKKVEELNEELNKNENRYCKGIQGFYLR